MWADAWLGGQTLSMKPIEITIMLHWPHQEEPLLVQFRRRRYQKSCFANGTTFDQPS